MKIRFFWLLLPLAVFPALAHAVPVKIIVTGPDEKPVAEAKVEYFAIDENTQRDMEKGDTPPLKTAQTGADGTLTLDFPEPPKPKGAVPATTETEQSVFLSLARISAQGLVFQTLPLKSGDNPIKLQKAGQVRGVINSVDGKPAPNLKVHLRGVASNGADLRYAYYGEGFPPEEAITGADGTWTMADVPTEGIAQFEIEAENTALLRFQVILDGPQNEAMAQTLKKGGTIRGRVLDGDGKPLAATIIADNLWDRRAKTDKAGNYVLTGMGVGNHALQVNTDSEDWVITQNSQPVSLPETGGEAKAPDVVGAKGVLVSGRFLEKGTNAPIVQMGLFLSGNSSRSAKTDDKGRFSARLAPGRLWISLNGSREIYREPNTNREVPAVSPTFDLGDIVLERGLTVKVDARTEDGKPAPQAELLIKNDNSSAYSNWNSKEKLAIFGALAPGKYTVSGRGGWEVIDAQPVEVAEGKNAMPLVVKVRKGTLPKVTGLVVDDEGKPMASATVSLTLSAEEGWTTNRTVLTKRDGSWSLDLDEAKMTPSVRGVELPGYLRTSGGELKLEGKDWKATNLIISRSDGELHGKIVDAAGKPLPGARITWTGAKDNDVSATGANGTFSLQGVPRGEITLWASDGQSFVATQGKAGQDTQIKLPAAPAPQDRTALQEKLWNELSSSSFSTLGSYWNVFGSERLLAAALKADGVVHPDGTRDATKAGRNLDTFLGLLGRRDPEHAAVIGVALLRQYPIKAPGSGVRQIALLAAQSDDAGARAWAGEWFDTQKLRVSMQDASPDSVENALGVGTVGFLLGRTNAAAYRDLGLVLADGKFTSDSLQKAVEWGRILWMGGKDQFDDAIGDWSAPVQMMAVAGALGSVKSAEEVNPLLARLAAFATDPAIKEYEAKNAANNEDWRPGFSYALTQGRSSAIRALARKDPKTALEILLQITEGYEAQSPAFVVAQAALQAGQLDIARAAARVGLKDNESGRAGAARMAVLAQGFDPALAQELMTYARNDATTNDDSDQSWRTIAGYAFALQTSDAATGRLLIEREWARRQAQGASDYNNQYQSQGLIWAMGAYDPARALEWLDKMPDQYGNKARLKADITALVFADDKTRPLLKRNDGSE